MTYDDLTKILLDDNCYHLIKKYEEEIFLLLPELKVCKGFDQHNKWHIYDVYEHILHVVSLVKPDYRLKIAALFHDIGKPACFVLDDYNIGHFYNHWNKSKEIFLNYASKFSLSDEDIILIANLIEYHDIDIKRLDETELKKMVKNIGKENILLLFNHKQADLLSQNPEYHYLLKDIDKTMNLIKRI